MPFCTRKNIISIATDFINIFVCLVINNYTILIQYLLLNTKNKCYDTDLTTK
jgi:hypothetical protein